MKNTWIILFLFLSACSPDSKAGNHITEPFPSFKAAGALCDGVTDDTAAIQRAFDSFPAIDLNRDSVYLAIGRGTCRITSPIQIPRVQVILYGEGAASIILADKTTAFKFNGGGTMNSVYKDFSVKGDATPNAYAFDTASDTPEEFVSKITWKNLRIETFNELFNIPNCQLCVWEEGHYAAEKAIFRIYPTNTASNSNRVIRVRFAGINVTMFDYQLNNTNERMSNWAFRDCDIQFAGNRIPIIMPDTFFVLENCEFENSTAPYLVKLTNVPGIAQADHARIIGNLFSGARVPILISGTGSNQPNYITILGNGPTSRTLVDIDTNTGVPVMLINNSGDIGRQSRATMVIGGYAGSNPGLANIMIANTIGNDVNGITVDSISGQVVNGKGVIGRNLRGSLTLSGSSTIVQFFWARPEPDNDYRITATPDANENIWITNKTITGFTINSSNPASTAMVDWILIR